VDCALTLKAGHSLPMKNICEPVWPCSTTLLPVKKSLSAIGQLATSLRQGIERAFAAEGIKVVCTGGGQIAANGSSFFMVNFPEKDNISYSSPEDIWDPARSDVFLREEALKLALLINGVHVVHGGGCLSTAHTGEDIGKPSRLINRLPGFSKSSGKQLIDRQISE